MYAKHPATLTLLCSLAALLVVWYRPLFGGAVIPYDYQTAHYPWYVDAIRAARYSIFCLYNPYNDAGQPVWNIAAFNDPIEWLPVFFPHLPGYTALQSLELLHLLLIPCGLLLVARANGVPKQRWIWIAVIAGVAYAVGPTLKYMQQAVALVAYSYIVLAFGSLEAFRTTGKRHYALLAGVAIAYVFEAFVYPALFLPIALLGYGFANFRELAGSRQRVVSLALGFIALVLVVAPALLLSLKVDHLIDVAFHLTQVEALRAEDIPSLLGAATPLLELVALPASLVALACAGFANLSRRQMICYGIAIAMLVIYGFGDATPFGNVIRTLYPPAGLVRRPYTTWYVLVPLLLVLATIGLGVSSRRVVIRAATVASLVALLVQAALGAGVLASVAVGVTLAVTFWQPRLAVVVPVVVLQWLAIDWLPFSNSAWQPEPIDPAAMYDGTLKGLEPYLSGNVRHSSDAFRIANIGLPAEVGPSAGMYQYRNVAADYNTFIPHTLVEELGTPALHATKLMPYVIENPSVVGSLPWERLATKYYIVGPTVFDAISKSVASSRHLHVVTTPSFWHVIEDDSAAPYVSGVRDDGSLVPIDADMTRDSFAFTVPDGVSVVRFAANFDRWWHARDRDEGSAPLPIADDNGQLTLPVSGLAGHRVSLVYTDRLTVIAIGSTLAAQTGLVLLFAALAIVAVRARVTRRP